MLFYTDLYTTDSFKFIYTIIHFDTVHIHYLVNCDVPNKPANGNISDYDNINTTEGSVIFVQCNPGFLLQGDSMIATCTNAGVWDPDPAGVECRGKQWLTKM